MKTINSKEGPTVTLFVPYDCNNACPFCINKGDYRDTSNFDFERCLKSLDLMNGLLPYNDIALTGGEPFAELDALQMILDRIDDNHHVYINTTLPTNENQDERRLAEVINKYEGKIDCINVSRHLKHYVKECSDEIFDMIKVPHRINCVVFQDATDPTTKEELINFLERFNGHHIQLRANYSLLTLDNVFDTEHDELFKLISEVCTYEDSLEKELFRTGFDFRYKDSLVTYHKTLPYSKVNGVVGDIIIRQTGKIYDDWNTYGQELNVNDVLDALELERAAKAKAE
jgi:molybdenum cofactor biosynthesis enzyme MoaA